MKGLKAMKDRTNDMKGMKADIGGGGKVGARFYKYRPNTTNW